MVGEYWAVPESTVHTVMYLKKTLFATLLVDLSQGTNTLFGNATFIYFLPLVKTYSDPVEFSRPEMFMGGLPLPASIQ